MAQLRDYSTNPLKVIALCKTFGGEEFVEAMVESVYNHVDKIVFVHSNISWTGETGNTVLEPLAKWAQTGDNLKKLVHVGYDTCNQVEQYNAGLRYIREHFEYDFILLVDTDEIWNNLDLITCKQFLQKDCQHDAFTVNMRTYIKSPFYRLRNIEPCKPTVFIRNNQTSIAGVRGNAIVPRTHIPGVFMHHFTYVRKSDADILAKIKSSTQEDHLKTVDLDVWIEQKWNKLPGPTVTDLHTSRGYEHYWQGVELVTKQDLPEVFHKREFPIIRMFQNESERDIVKRHATSFEVIKSNAINFDLKYRRGAWEYQLIKQYCRKDDSILEIGCLTGHNILNLALEGYEKVSGIEFLLECVVWAQTKAIELDLSAPFFNLGKFPIDFPSYPKTDKIIVFDVLEHVENQGLFLEAVNRTLSSKGEALILVPKGKEYYDPTHVNFYPDLECLRNILSMYFKILELREINNKLFARCIAW